MASQQSSQTTQTLKFSEIQKFKGGMISGSFLTINGKPIQVKLENVVAPLGVSNFNGKKSLMLNIEDSHDVSILEVIQEACTKHPDLKDKILNDVIKSSDKYGKQLKVNITNESCFYTFNTQETDDTILDSRCLINALVEVNMVWVRGKEAGVSLKLLQARHLKAITNENAVLPKQCLI